MAKNLTVNISLNGEIDFEKINETIRKEIERVGVKVEIPKYRKVTDREPRVGDFVKFEGRVASYLQAKEYYEIVEIDYSDDPQVIDDDGDGFDAGGCNYEVFERVTGTEESIDVLTHNGAEYRRVHRMAKDGDVVVIGRGGESPFFDSGKPYEVVSEIVNNSIAAIGNDGDTYAIYMKDYNRTLDNVKVYEPVAKEQPFKVGDYAKVVKLSPTMNGFSVGDIVKFIRNDDGLCNSQIEALDDYRTIGYGDKGVHIVKATDEEVAEANRKAHKASFSAGDYARVTNKVCEFDVGNIVKIVGDRTATDANVFDFKVEYVNVTGECKFEGNTHGYIDATNIEKLSKAEAQEAAKWVKIGRKYAEFKNGDIVRVINSRGSSQRDGNIGEIAHIDGTIYRVNSLDITRGNFLLKGQIELITPVEQRFDRL
jgi:hypothetical protein